MKPFLANLFLRVSAGLGEASSYKSVSGEQGDHTARIGLIEIFADLRKQCEELELSASFETSEKILYWLTQQPYDNSKLIPLITELKGRILDETQRRQFFSLTLQESKLYQKPLTNWERIVERFPQTVSDIEEMWKCFALSRYTASVFHSVQVVEIGLIELGTFIEVSDPLSGWTAVSNRLKQIVDTKYQNLTQFQQDNRSFLEQAHGTVEALKNAWRNKVSHSAQKLTLMTGEEFHPDVAEEILLATRAFMRRLAEGLPPKSESI